LELLVVSGCGKVHVDRVHRVVSHAANQVNAKACCVSTQNCGVYVTLVVPGFEETVDLGDADDEYDAGNDLTYPYKVEKDGVQDILDKGTFLMVWDLIAYSEERICYRFAWTSDQVEDQKS
jgi:hypothetical protein